MTVRSEKLTAFKTAIGDITHSDDVKLLEAKSKDYYWYSPILKDLLDNRVADLVVTPRTEDEVRTVAAAAARLRLPITVRGGGTGNYGQCVPMDGGIILEMTKLDRIIDIAPGRVICEAGARMERVETAAGETGQMLSMFPSTKRFATMGGFVSGGSGGIGSLRNGMLRDGENITWLRMVTVEDEPRIIELRGADIMKVQHAYGTNGIITAMDYALVPATDWVHTIALFDGYDTALRFAAKAQDDGLDAYLMTVVEGRIAPFYKRLADYFPADKDAVFSMIAPDAMADFRARVAAMDGTVSLTGTLHALESQRLPPAWECGWNHTTLQALKHEPGVWTYLQVAYPSPFDPDLVMRQIARYGDEVLMHHEMARLHGEVQIFALPLVRWTTRERMYEIITEMERLDGCMIYDPHAITIEDGGMKEIDTTQIDFKREADPHGLMNPGKTRGWTPDMAKA
ncbi:MAG: FAD-binding oxidoreductase [Paracoccaceae bacterium]